MRIALGQHLPKGQRPPKRLTATQTVRSTAARPGIPSARRRVAASGHAAFCCLFLVRIVTRSSQRVIAALVEAHGDDVAAMTRDLKRNAMQHTAGVRRAGNR